MEDLLSVIVFVLYLIAVTAFGKNKRNKKKQQNRAQRSAPQFEQVFEQVFDSLSASVRKEREKAAAKPERIDAPEGTDPCHESMLGEARSSIRYHNASQLEMHTAGEGEDPCHISDARDDLQEENSPVYCSPIFNTEDNEAFANDIVRGIIMSEVLKRPSERRVGLEMKRRA